MKLNNKGQCPTCKRKPLTYKRDYCFYCPKCRRQYSMFNGNQEPNFAWKWLQDSEGPKFERV